MRPPLKLTSVKNPTVLAVAELFAKRRARDDNGTFAVEGAREIDRAVAGGYALRQLFVCPELQRAGGLDLGTAPYADVERFELTVPVFAKLAVRDGSDGIVGVFAQQRRSLAELAVALAEQTTPLILAVHGLEKPGNLGALLRTADGVGVDAVVLLDETVDLYNPHVIRGSVGAVFGQRVVTATSTAFREFCAQRGVRIIAAALKPGARPHYDATYTGGVAVLLGNEATGLPSTWLEQVDEAVMIPMRGLADSLNVSVAGAVILYEALRQRR